MNPNCRVNFVSFHVVSKIVMPVCRVMQEYDADESVREFSLFATSRGDTIFTQSWMPVSNKVRLVFWFSLVYRFNSILVMFYFFIYILFDLYPH